MNTMTSAFQIKSLCLNSWQARSSPAPVKKWCVAVFLVSSLTVMWFFVFIVSWSFPGRLASSEWSGYFSSLCPLRRSSRHSPASCCCKMTKVSYWNLKCTNTQITDLIIRLVSTNITLWTYWMKPAWRSCLAFCSLCFSCSSCLL